MEKMSRPLSLNPANLPPTYGVLKSLLENPMKLPVHQDDAFGKEKAKEKKVEDDSNDGAVPQSAFLGPTLWDKTLPYDGDTFQLEYMDLEEFLSENGIPPSQSPHDHISHQSGLQQPPVTSPSVMDLSGRAAVTLLPGVVPQTCMHSPVRPGGRGALRRHTHHTVQRNVAFRHFFPDISSPGIHLPNCTLSGSAADPHHPALPKP